jgi:putative phosphoribosyl transferase
VETEEMVHVFINRVDAGRRLGERLHHLRSENVVVVGLPRGGVPVAAGVAEAIGAPLDVIMVRKLGVPRQPELAMGAIGEGGVCVLASETVRRAGVTDETLAAIKQREGAELERRAVRFRHDRERIPLAGRTVVVVDDGVATGATARAACQVVAQLGAVRVVLAVPVAPQGWVRGFRGVADELVDLITPRQFSAIGRWYSDFSQTTDEEVIACLREAGAREAQIPAQTRRTAAAVHGVSADVEVQAGPMLLAAILTVPPGATGVVLFAHGSGSGRHSPRNRFVAQLLNQAGLGTVLLDLLTPEEERNRANVFDVRLLAARLGAATQWLHNQRELSRMRIGYFGASTGAGAALWAAAEPPTGVSAVVSRGGRPDLAAPRLSDVSAPTLLIVGELDEVVLDLNRRAQSELRCPSRLVVVPGATHLFEEPGALDAVAGLAGDWFTRHLAPQPAVFS